jgi:DNA-binding transcriptional LysR family regulator
MLAWDDLRLCLLIAREGTLSAAARKLGVDQSTVSRRLAALEAASGVRLVERSRRGYALTRAGDSVRATLEEMEQRALSVERTLAGRDAGVTGRVRIATSDSFAAWFLIERLGPLRARYPELVLELVTGNQVASLARREADLSVRLFKPSESDLVGVRLGTGAWAAYASPHYLARRARTRRGRGLGGHDWIDLDGELAGTAGARFVARQARQGRVVMSANSLHSVAAAVLAGHGASALPCLYGDAEPRVLRLPSGVIGEHDIWLVVHPELKGSARVRAVIDYLKELVQREAPLLSGARPRVRVRARTNGRRTDERHPARSAGND